MQRQFLAVIAFAFALADAAPAQATPITFGFTGLVTQVPADDPAGGVTVGSAISGQYTFDSAAVDGIANPAQASYLSSGPGFGLSVQIGANTYEVSGSLYVNVSNGVLAVDQYGVLADDFTALSISLLLEDWSAAVFGSDALPTIVPSLGSFVMRDFHLVDSSAGDVQIDGTIETLTCLQGCGGGSSIPEPGTLTLAGVGLLAAALRRRSCHQGDGVRRVGFRST